MATLGRGMSDPIGRRGAGVRARAAEPAPGAANGIVYARMGGGFMGGGFMGGVPEDCRAAGGALTLALALPYKGR